jgi:hypothetical protein
VAFVELLPWLGIPVVFGLLHARLAPPPGPPTLLVLRVFQHASLLAPKFKPG